MPMVLSVDLKAPNPGSLPIVELSDADQAKAQAVHRYLQEMSDWSNEVANSLALFNLMRDNFLAALDDWMGPRRFGLEVHPTELLDYSWMHMAARYGGLSVRNFGQSLEAVGGLAGRISAWKGEVDIAALGLARKRFTEYFPTIHKLRHAVAHPEHFANPDKDMSIPSGPDGGRTMIRSLLQERTLIYTFAGKNEAVAEEVRYELSHPTVFELIAICRDCFAAFSSK